MRSDHYWRENQMQALCIKKHEVDICVIGGGLSGCFAAIEVFDNHQRFIKHTLNMTVNAVRFIPLSTYHSERKTNDYGSSTAHIFNFEIL